MSGNELTELTELLLNIPALENPELSLASEGIRELLRPRPPLPTVTVVEDFILDGTRYFMTEDGAVQREVVDQIVDASQSENREKETPGSTEGETNISEPIDMTLISESSSRNMSTEVEILDKGKEKLDSDEDETQFIDDNLLSEPRNQNMSTEVDAFDKGKEKLDSDEDETQFIDDNLLSEPHHQNMSTEVNVLDKGKEKLDDDAVQSINNNPNIIAPLDYESVNRNIDSLLAESDLQGVSIEELRVFLEHRLQHWEISQQQRDEILKQLLKYQETAQISGQMFIDNASSLRNLCFVVGGFALAGITISILPEVFSIFYPQNVPSVAPAQLPPIIIPRTTPPGPTSDSLLTPEAVFMFLLGLLLSRKK